MAATDAKPVPRKNVAFRHYFSIRNSSGAYITSWAGQDSEVSLDGASFSDCTNEATEIGTSGHGYIDLTAAEMNADSVILKITVTNSGALPLTFVFYPEEAGDYRADVTHFGGTAGTFSGGRPEVNATHLAGTAYASADLSSTMKASVNTEADTALSDYGPLKPTTAGRTLDVSTGGEAGIDWANVGSPTTAVGLSNTTLADVTVNALRSNVITAASIASDAITAAKIATDAISAIKIAADAVTKIQTNLATAVALDAVDNYIDTEVAAIKAKTDLIPASPAATGDIPSAATIASQVRTELTTELGRIDAAVSTRSTLDAAGIRTAVGLATANLDTQLSTIDTVVDSILADTGTDGVVLSTATKDAIATSILTLVNGIETDLTLQGCLRLMAAILISKASGLESGTETYRDFNDTKNRIVATLAAGARTLTTVDAT